MDKIRFLCRTCHRKLGALPSAAGGQVRCPDCGSVQVVPPLPTGLGGSAPEASAAPPEVQEDQQPVGFAPAEPGSPASPAAPEVSLLEFAARDSATAEELRYEAFISYRHVEPDRRWAKWLHTALETYRVPAALVKERGLAPRIRRIFRDEDELPASADLNKEIESALKASRFLIVICSPRTPESEWVNKEVERFRELGRHDQILALLIEGEPAEAFPRALREIRKTLVDAGGARQEQLEEVEPLAADVRSSRGESMRRLKRMARLRMLACILGCRFDDLRQREHERHVRRTVFGGIAALVLLLVIAGLGALSLFLQMEAQRQTLIAKEQTVGKLEAEKQARLQEDEATRQRRIAAEQEKAAQESARKEAEARKHAKASEEVATKAGTKAEAETQRADEKEKLAAEKVKAAHEAAELREKTQYALHIQEALAAWTDGDGARQTRLLDECRPQDRAWEWGYVRRLAVKRVTSFVSRLEGDLDVGLDGKQLVVAGYSPSDNKNVRILDIASGRTLLALDQANPSKAGVRCAALSADGSRLATGGQESVMIWDAKDGKCLHVLPHGSVSGIAFSRDGRLMATAAYGVAKGMACVRVWDARTFKPLLGFDPDKSAWCVALNPDGKLLAAGGPGEGLKVWQLQGARAKLLFEDKVNNLGRLEFSPDGSQLLGAEHEKNVIVWSVATGKVLRRLPLQSDAVDARFSPDGQVIAAGTDKEVVFFDAASGNKLLAMPSAMPDCSDYLKRLRFLPDSRRLVLTDSNHIQVWDASLPPASRSVIHKGSELIRDVVFSADAGRFLSLDEYATVRVWDLASAKDTLLFKAPLGEAAFNADGTWLAVAKGGFDAEPLVVKVWSLGQTAELMSVHEPDLYYPRGVALSSDGALVAAAGPTGGKEGRTGAVKVWRVGGGRQATAIQTERPACAAAFSHDGRLLACLTDQQVTLHDARTGGKLAESDKALGVPGEHLIFSPDDTLFAVGGGLFDTATCRRLRRVPHPILAISPDNRRVATSSDPKENGLFLWDASTGVELLRFRRECPVTCARFSRDGRFLIAGWKDGTIEIREAAPMEGSFERITAGAVGATEEGLLPAKGDEVSALAVSPDGRRIAVHAGKAVVIWDALNGRPLQRLEPPVITAAYVPADTLHFSGDGRRLAAGNRIIDIAAARCLTDFSPRSPGDNLIIWMAPDKGMLAATRSTKRLKWFEGADGREVRSLPCANDSVVFSPDGKQYMVFNSRESTEPGPDGKRQAGGRTSVLYDAETGAEVADLGEDLRRVCFMAGGTLLATLDGNSVLAARSATSGEEVWVSSARDLLGPAEGLVAGGNRLVVRYRGRFEILDARTGRLEQTFLAGSEFLDRLACSADGGTIVIAGRTSGLTIWRSVRPNVPAAPAEKPAAPPTP